MADKTIVAFDLYGTLLSTESIAKQLEKHIGPKAEAVSALWRRYQLEYTWRLNSMGRQLAPGIRRRLLTMSRTLRGFLDRYEECAGSRSGRARRAVERRQHLRFNGGLRPFIYFPRCQSCSYSTISRREYSTRGVLQRIQDHGLQLCPAIERPLRARQCIPRSHHGRRGQTLQAIARELSSSSP